MISNLVIEFGKNYDTTIVSIDNVAKNDTYKNVGNIKINENSKSSLLLFIDKILNRLKLKKININNKMRLFFRQQLKRTNDKVILIPLTADEIKLCIELKKEFKERVILVPYILERLPDSLFFLQRDKLKKEILEFSDFIFVLPVVEKYFKSSKTVIVEHPMVVNNIKSNIKNKNSNNINVTFIGGIDRKNRNPLPFLNKLFDSPFSNNHVKFNFYGYGNLNQQLKEISEKNITFNFGGSVDPSKAKDILRESDVLLSIGNKNNKLVPSKIFDYLSTGLPIIHFTQNENDPYIEYLEKYPYKFIAPLNEVNIANLYNFIIQNSESLVNFTEIENNFIECTPKFVFNEFRKRILIDEKE